MDSVIATPPFISSYGRYMTGLDQHLASNISMPNGQTWTGPNALYIPMWLPWRYVVRRMFWVLSGGASGSNDIGIYTPGGALLWSAGPTVQAGSSYQPQFVTLATPLLLTPGPYLLAIGMTNSASYDGTVPSTLRGRMSGIRQQAVSTLPATATFAQYSGIGYPLVGFTNTASGF